MLQGNSSWCYYSEFKKPPRNSLALVWLSTDIFDPRMLFCWHAENVGGAICYPSFWAGEPRDSDTLGQSDVLLWMWKMRLPFRVWGINNTTALWKQYVTNTELWPAGKWIPWVVMQFQGGVPYFRGGCSGAQDQLRSTGRLVVSAQLKPVITEQCISSNTVFTLLRNSAGS